MHTPFWKRRYFTAMVLSVGLAGYCVQTQAIPSLGVVLVVGDSISAEYGLQRGQGWVALLSAQLDAKKFNAQVINASLSGETTAGGRSRLPALLRQHQPDVVIIELGGNDALRGLALDQTQDNLLTMTQAAKAAGAKVLLLGMQMPPNYGADYAKQFTSVYAKVAQQSQVRLLPFFLKGIGDDPDPMKWFQPDRIHPNVAAQPRLLENVWPELKPWLVGKNTSLKKPA
jgi:acyl-CoA thioesterase-1